MDHLGIEQAAVVGHSIGGQMVTRFAFLYPERTTHLVTVNQVGLTDGRKGRGFQTAYRRSRYQFRTWTKSTPACCAGRDDNYVNWKPEFAEHMRIRYGNRLSGDWPRMAYVSRLTGQMRGMDTVVNDWQHIETKTLILGGAEDYSDLCRGSAPRR